MPNDDKMKKCGNCLMCVHYDSCFECALTNNQVDDEQESCIDYISED